MWAAVITALIAVAVVESNVANVGIRPEGA
jgi:hypothetical protein